MRYPFIYVMTILSLMACDQSEKSSRLSFGSPNSEDASTIQSADPDYITYKVDLQQHLVRFFWKNSRGDHYKRIGTVKEELAKQQINLLYAVWWYFSGRSNAARIIHTGS